MRDSNADTSLSSPQLKALIQLTRQALQDAQLGDTSTAIMKMNQPTLCFTLARSLLSKKILLVDMFDLMQTVSEGIIISPNASTREQCRHLLLHFLKDYPMADNKKLDHLNMLLRNLRYEQVDGRLSVCGMLGMIVDARILDELINVQAWCLAAIERMANEGNEECVEAVGALVRNLISKHGSDQIFELVDKWNSNANPHIRISSLKLLRWIGMGFIDAGHAKLVLRRVALFKDCDESIAEHHLRAFSAWIPLSDTFFKYKPNLQPFYHTHPSQVIHIMRLCAERGRPVGTDHLLAMLTTHPSEDMLQALVHSAKPELLRKIIGIAKRDEGEAVLSLACQYALNFMHSRPALDVPQTKSLLSLINYCRTQSKCLTHIDGLDQELRECLGSTGYADALHLHSTEQHARRMARHALLANLAVTDPSAAADVRLRRNRKRAEQRREKSKKRKGLIAMQGDKKRRKRDVDGLEDLF